MKLMGIFKRMSEPSPKMVAVPDPMAEFLMQFLAEDPSLPHPDRVNGAETELITEEEARRREAASRNMPSIEELLRDPNVAIVVEAATGLEPVPDSFVKKS